MLLTDALRGLLHLKDPPRRTALAFGVGVSIAFSPLLGLHTLIAIAVAFVFRLNRVAVVAGAWINAWALLPCYAFGTLIGALLLGVDARHLDRIDWDRADSSVWASLSSFLVGDWRHAFRSFGTALRGLGALLWPFVLGNTILASLVGILAYALARRFLEARAIKHSGSHQDDPPLHSQPQPPAA